MNLLCCVFTGLFGATDPYHLIAFKEDPDSRPQLEAGDDVVPSVLLPTQGRQSPARFKRDAKSTLSGGTGRSSQLQTYFSELKEMALLVDVDSEFQDITEAHVRFQRDEQPSNVPSALRSTMPSLRKLVKPAEWEKLRSKAVKFSERGLLDPTLQPRVLKHMTLQLPGHSGWVLAEEAALTRFPNKGAERKVWLHLKRFRPEKSPRGPSDGDIFPSTLRSRQSRQTDGQGTENAVATGENAREV
ncbi:unnamed protein product [Durusdinium trenchii]|uniref:Peptidoglycan binding-like domain-containing protein n=1 Tax=Durusdinium trenchii TaxID=1381693 RepID=A0ABP0L4J5_9DINO